MKRSGGLLLLWALLLSRGLSQPDRVHFAIRFVGESGFTTPAGTHAYRETRYQLNDTPEHAWGYRHRYRVFDLPKAEGPAEDAPAPLTNGHLHATGPVFRLHARCARLTLHPLVAVSSNVLRDQRDLEMSDLQLHARIAWGARDALEPGWSGGIVSDTRWGRQRVYPFLSWQSDPEHPVWLRAGFPDSSLHWTPANAWAVQVDVGPSGGVWRTRDADFQQRGTFRQQGGQVTATVTRHLCAHLSVSLGLEHEFARQWEVPLENGETDRLRPPADTRGTLAVSLRF